MRLFRWSTRSPARRWLETSIATDADLQCAGAGTAGYLPAINPTLDPNNCGFVFYAIPYLLTDNQFVTRVDYTVSSKQNIYGRYFVDGYQFPAYF